MMLLHRHLEVVSAVTIGQKPTASCNPPMHETAAGQWAQVLKKVTAWGNETPERGSTEYAVESTGLVAGIDNRPVNC